MNTGLKSLREQLQEMLNRADEKCATSYRAFNNSGGVEGSPEHVQLQKDRAVYHFYQNTLLSMQELRFNLDKLDDELQEDTEPVQVDYESEYSGNWQSYSESTSYGRGNW